MRAPAIVSVMRLAVPRRLHSSTPTSTPLTLHSISPLIRPQLTSASSTPSSSSTSSASSTSGCHISRSSNTISEDSGVLKETDFLLWPDFFTPLECRVLSEMALWKLDRVDSKRKRRRRGSIGAQAYASDREEKTNDGSMEGLQSLFSGEYGFEEGHYDSVIHHYRETLLSSLPPTSPPSLSPLLTRLYSLLPELPPTHDIPPPGTSTHLLHLAPEGEILGHVDNLEASGSVICGISLGAERTLRLVKKGEREGRAGWDVRLPSGSVYLQRDSVRYGYEHSILHNEHEGSVWDGERLSPGHRISIMIRDAPSQPAKLQ
ncbi:hypothetical protein IAR55_000785 [Kwoniella newhampshirensis]|uniref:Alpha-ketoglutarate-dependent dioxygenase AlkB-like domain-containing protein n=1 Tax=Kwoniella newhampshirensis TaxID=1651941 RepID=A0AAW0Z3Z6_9TREE